MAQAYTDNRPQLQELIESLGESKVVTNPATIDNYRWDRANDPGAGIPIAVVRATSSDDVQTTIRFASSRSIPVVARGAGSGLSGGSSAVDGGIILSMENMRDIEINPLTRTAVVQPGAFNAEVKAAAAEHGLWYPPDPSSFEFCSIGGNIATNAGGLCCVKYGVTADYVLGMKVVLADGREVVLGGPRLKDVAGLNLTQLFVGSEGTLGVITEVTLRLVPAQRPPTTLVATFSSLDDSTAAVLGIASTMRPSMLEFMDHPTINAVEDATGMGLDRDAAAMLIIQSDEPAEYAAKEIEHIEALCNQHNATDIFATSDREEAEAVIAARRMAIPAVEQQGTVLLEDVGVPLPRLGDLVRGMEHIAQDRDVMIAVIAHAGDGNTHPLLVFDPMNEDQKRRAHIAYGEVMDLAVRLGGTITGEHGVGRLKRPWLVDSIGEDALELNYRIKKALDPQNIFNPGAVFDPAAIAQQDPAQSAGTP
ncbi:FAD-linked oxidase C-terminal domain-containing protein [Enteractinococcus fodinae]|uniref:Glycolate oxidase n=1 Tax=Enteractinococcus fodinae TaxID=684663 RepID=A0ABU2B1T9_9MICC|nr:FAD-linked oxidase C-terminal domain-containing protein [Enteractinococcus fodinae]MDR7347572.1 glycolate oxidase [Enteractinococcus fodinae]